MEAIGRSVLQQRLSENYDNLLAIQREFQAIEARLAAVERRASGAPLQEVGRPPLAELPAAQVPIDENPLFTGAYWVPVMTPGEMKAITVPLDEAPELLQAKLHEHGFAVVTGVLDARDCAELEAQFRQDLLDLVDTEAISRSPQAIQQAYERFVNDGLTAFPAATAARITEAAGFALGRCLPHGRFAWAVRRNAKVHAAFSAAFGGEEDLVTSQDVPFFTPGGFPPSKHCTFTAHVDQNAHDIRPGLADCEVYQGALYVWPVQEDSSTTVVLPKSHTQAWSVMMQDMSYKMSGQSGFHYSEVQEMCDQENAGTLAAAWAAHARRVPVPAGGLLLWNSRTIHTGWKGGPRLAQAVCLEPRSRRSPGERLSKMRLAALGLPSVHWASVAMQHDMFLNEPGYLSEDGMRGGVLGSHPDAVVLPLKPALRPVGLVDEADEESLADLVIVDYEYTGMWRAPAKVAPLLEANVRDDVKAYL